MPIDFTMQNIPECQIWPNVIEKGSQWAKINEEDAVKRMKKFIDSPTDIRKQAEKYFDELNENFGRMAVLQKWKDFYAIFVKNVDAKDSKEELKAYKNEKQNRINEIKKRYSITDSEKEKVIYIMPMSFGDVVISTLVVDSLINSRHFEDEFYFATKKEYFELLEGLVEQYNIKLIEYDDVLLHNELTREVWNVIYSPGVNIQYNFSNWTMGNGKYGLTLAQEMAKQCNLTPLELTDYNFKLKECTVPDGPMVSITPVSSKESKKYKYWDDIVSNIKEMVPDVKIVQLGLPDEARVEGTLDYRGKTFNETLYILSNSILHISPDTGTAHAAGALGIPHVVMFGSTNMLQCRPELTDNKCMQVCIESSKGCVAEGKACYKDQCSRNENGKNCLSNINPETVCNQIFKILAKIVEREEKKLALPILEETNGTT